MYGALKLRFKPGPLHSLRPSYLPNISSRHPVAMFVQRRSIPLLAAAFLAILLLSFYNSIASEPWKTFPQRLGLGELQESDASLSEASGSLSPKNHILTPVFEPGVPKPPGHNYSRVLVIPKIKKEDTKWIEEELPDLETAVYVADDPRAPLHPPKNKGHEVMVYLSYIIEHYNELPDIVIFMHSHRNSWHNDDLLEYDAVKMINSLSSPRVIREGYMNMRCDWGPGCPDWIFPGATEKNWNKQEEPLVAKAWGEIFPFDPIPQVLGQACCAQFAVAGGRIRSIPLGRFVHYRDWLLRTPLSDYVSGRIWEYIWQYAFTGKSVVCPAEHVCYCDGFGVCLGGKAEYDGYFEKKKKKEDLDKQLEKWEAKQKKLEVAKESGLDEADDLEVPEVGKDVEMKEEIDRLTKELKATREAAYERGKDPKIRAMEAGRDWKEGDGF